MTTRLRALALFSFLAISACGGGTSDTPAAAQPLRTGYSTHVMVRSAEYATRPAPGFDASVTFAWGATAEESVALQLRAPGRIMIFPPVQKGGADLDMVEAYAAAAAAHRYRVEWVFVYDELFWEWAPSGDATVQLGAFERQAIDAAAVVRRHGLKTAITISANVLLSPGFTLREPNAWDVIGVTLYPSARSVYGASGGADCAASPSLYKAWLKCSVQSLRDAGFTGEIWYVFQSYVPEGGEPGLAEQLHLQYEAILAGPEMGVAGIASFGYLIDFLHAPAAARASLDPILQLPIP